MSSASDALANPTRALQQLYDANKAQGIDKFPGIVTEHFQRVFAEEEDFHRIPTLDLQHPPPSFPNGSLVVFPAMVQDPSLSPELYLATRKNGECGGWGITDDLATGDDVEYGNLRECTAIWAVSIPGLSPWCYDETSSSSVAVHATVQPHKYPIPHVPHIGGQLKIYDENIARPLRATDLASFIGILTSEPLHAGIELSEPTNVPTLHVLFSAPIPVTIVPRPFPGPSVAPAATSLRNDLIKWIADEALAGDFVAAEWVLLCTIARVRSRQPPILPLSLTISNFPTHAENPNLPPTLHSVLSSIFPLVSLLPLSLDTLNNGSFCPESRDEDLYSGQLQLPKGSILLLNEGVVTEGGIFNKGVMNIRATQELMNSQTLDYVFPFSGFQFETDITCIVTTEGKKSTFFQTDITVPLRPQISENLTEKLYKSADVINLPLLEKLLNFRELVAGAKIGNVVVGEAMGKFVEEEFIRERSKNAEKSNGTTDGFTPDDLIQRMLLTRLNALSLHQTQVTQDNWESTKELEQALRSRKM